MIRTGTNRFWKRAGGLVVSLLVLFGLGGQGVAVTFVSARLGDIPEWVPFIVAFVGPSLGAWEGQRVARYLGLAPADTSRSYFEKDALWFSAVVLTLIGLWVSVMWCNVYRLWA